jgi:hypothetical protein
MSLIDAVKYTEKQNIFNENLSRIPVRWSGAVVDVVDTFAIVKQGLSLHDIDDPFVLTEAVRMAIERFDKSSEGDADD